MPKPLRIWEEEDRIPTTEEVMRYVVGPSEEMAAEWGRNARKRLEDFANKHEAERAASAARRKAEAKAQVDGNLSGEAESKAAALSREIAAAAAREPEPGAGSIFVCDTPASLVMVGCRQLPMHISRRHVYDIANTPGGGPSTHRHGLGTELLENLPQLIASPAMVLDTSPTATRQDAIVVVLDAVDREGRPVVAVVKPDGYMRTDGAHVESNYVLSVYGRRGMEGYLERAAREDRVLFVDKRKTERLQGRVGLRLLESVGATPLGRIVHPSETLGKRKQPPRERRQGKHIPARQESRRTPGVSEKEARKKSGRKGNRKSPQARKDVRR